MTTQCIATGKYNAFVNLEPIEVSHTSYRKTGTLCLQSSEALWVVMMDGNQNCNIRTNDWKEIIFNITYKLN